MKQFKNDTRSSTKNFISDTYRTVGLDTIDNLLGKSEIEVQKNWDKVVRKIDKSKYSEGTKFVIAISIKSGKFAIQKVLLPANSERANQMRKQKQTQKRRQRQRKGQSGDNPNKKGLDAKRESQQPHEIAYRRYRKNKK